MVHSTIVEPARKAISDWDLGSASLTINSVWGPKEEIMKRKY